MITPNSRSCDLELRDGRVHARLPQSTATIPVRLLWARPISGRGQEVSLVDDRKSEVFLLESLDVLDQASRIVAEAALAERYLIPRIQRVIATRLHLSTRYWDVETDRGQRRFAMREPNKNVVWITSDRAVIRDVLGNRYEIVSYVALDDRSKAAMEQVL